MKYWNELTSLESEIINMDKVSSTLTIISNSIDTSNYRDVQCALYLLQEYTEKLNKDMSEKFMQLFDAVRQVEFEAGAGTMDECYEHKELSEVINRWVNP